MVDSGFQSPRTRGTDNRATQPRAGRPTEAGISHVIDELTRISAMISPASARAACADLLFDFQPLIAACPDLLSRTFDVLEQCEATALRQRLLVAVHGDAAAGPESDRRRVKVPSVTLVT
jgi:hypothetical protein